MNTKARLILTLAIAAGSILLFSTQTLGADKIIVRPKLHTSWQADSNFFKAEIMERDVYTYLVQPGIVLGYETDKSMILLDYTLNSYFYDERDDPLPGQLAADEDDYVGHTLVFNARSQVFEKLAVGLDNSYYVTREPADSDRFSNSVARDKYSINRLTPVLFYESEEQFSVGLRYRNTITDYREDDVSMEDSDEHRGMLDIIYNFSDTASLDLGYQFWARDYDKTTSDYTSNQINLIFKKQFQYFTFEAGGGYQNREFDNDALDNIDTPTYRVAIIGQTPPAPETRPRSHVSLTAEGNFNDSGSGEQYYTANRFALDAGHIFLEKIPTNINASYQNSDYEKTFGLTPSGTIELRDDDTYAVSFDIGYMFTEWLTFTARAGYEERDSNLAGFSYENTYFMFQLAFDYDMRDR